MSPNPNMYNVIQNTNGTIIKVIIYIPYLELSFGVSFPSSLSVTGFISNHVLGSLPSLKRYMIIPTRMNNNTGNGVLLLILIKVRPGTLPINRK